MEAKLRRKTSAGSHTFTAFHLISCSCVLFFLKTTKSSIKVQACFFKITLLLFSCILLPSTLTLPLTLHSFFYSLVAFPFSSESTIVVFLLPFPQPWLCVSAVSMCVCVCVCVRVCSSLFLTLFMCMCWCASVWMCVFVDMWVTVCNCTVFEWDPVMMSLTRNGGQPLVTVTVCDQCGSLKSPDWLDEMLTYLCILLFLNGLE